MARPTRSGVDYFPLDADFFGNKKVRLIEAEFGEKGLMILLRVLCELYRTGGYCMNLDRDSALLTSADVTSEIDSELILRVVERCTERGIFDRNVLDSYGVLTSRGIQRRYLKMVFNRKHISIIRDYWILDEDDPDDIPPAILKKIVVKSIAENVSEPKTCVCESKTGVSDGRNTTKQSKVKQSKAEQSKRAASAPTCSALSRVSEIPTKMTRGCSESFVSASERMKLFFRSGRRRNGAAKACSISGRYSRAEAHQKLRSHAISRPTPFPISKPCWTTGIISEHKCAEKASPVQREPIKKRLS